MCNANNNTRRANKAEHIMIILPIIYLSSYLRTYIYIY